MKISNLAITDGHNLHIIDIVKRNEHEIRKS